MKRNCGNRKQRAKWRQAAALRNLHETLTVTLTNSRLPLRLTAKHSIEKRFPCDHSKGYFLL